MAPLLRIAQSARNDDWVDAHTCVMTMAVSRRDSLLVLALSASARVRALCTFVSVRPGPEIAVDRDGVQVVVHREGDGCRQL